MRRQSWQERLVERAIGPFLVVMLAPWIGALLFIVFPNVVRVAVSVVLVAFIVGRIRQKRGRW